MHNPISDIPTPSKKRNPYYPPRATEIPKELPKHSLEIVTHCVIFRAKLTQLRSRRVVELELELMVGLVVGQVVDKEVDK